jgi:hypothetical protein
MSKDVTTLIKSLELELLQPGTRSSAERLNEILSDDFLEIGESGNRYDKQSILKLLPTLGNTKYILSDFRVLKISSDALLASYSIEKEIDASGTNSHSLRISLWQKSNDQWQILFHQGIHRNSGNVLI